MIEFKPSNRDILNALTLRVLQDDAYVLECLKECGLEKPLLENESAKKYILDDLRANFKPIMKENFDVTDSFKRFVNGLGYYNRISPYNTFAHTLQMRFDSEKELFEVYKFHEVTETTDSTNVTIVKYIQEQFDLKGIEIRRSCQTNYAYADGKHEKITEISTREDDMVTYTTVTYDSDGNVLSQKKSIVSPDPTKARLLDPYLDTSELPDEDIPRIIEFVQLGSHLSERKKRNPEKEQEERKRSEDKQLPKTPDNDGIEEALDLPNNDDGIDMDDDDGLEL